MVANPPQLAGPNGTNSQDTHQAQDRRAATLPHQDRRQFFEKGAVVLNQGVRDRSTDFGRDAVLDPSRTARPQMAAMVATVFPDLATSQSSQSGAFQKAFENPALIRSFLINPQETAYFLMQRFPEMSDVILKNMPFQKIGNHLEPNVYSGLYRHISDEVGRGVRAHDSGVRREMGKLLSSFMVASVGGSSGMETKAYELLRNRIEKPGFNKEAERIEYRIAKLMTSPQARQDLKEAQGLAGLGALPGTPQPSFVQPQPIQPPIQPVNQPDPRSAIPASTGGSGNPVDLKPGTVPGIAPVQSPIIAPLPPSTVVPSSVTSSPAIRESIPGGSATAVAPSTVAVAEGTNGKGSTPVPPATTSPAPQTSNMISERERMLQDQVAQLQAQLNKQASTPVTPAPVATPAPSADVDQLRQQNKDLNERLATVEKTLTELASKNAALEQENKELKAKVLDLQKQNEALKKSQKQEPAPADKQSTEQKQALSDQQIKERAKQVYGAKGYPMDDPEAVYSALADLKAADQARLSATFKKEYSQDLDAYIAGYLGASELGIVMKLREGSRPGTEDAIKVYNILNGWTEKTELTQALKGKTIEEVAAMAKEYEYLTGQSFKDAIKSEFWFESDRKPFLDAFDRADNGVKHVEGGSPVFKQAHQSISSLSPNATIAEAREWAAKNRALYESLGATPGNQAEFISYLQKVHGFKKDQGIVNPVEFFNEKIADAAVREIASAVIYKPVRSYPSAPVSGPTTTSIAEPDREKIGKIVDSLSDLPDVQGLVRNHPDVNKLALETKPAAPKAEAPVSAPKENDPAPVIAPVAPPQATPQMKVDPPKMETQVRVTPSSSLPQLVDLLNSGKGDVQEFLLSNKTDLFARTDEEVTKAFRQVNPAKMERFAGSLKYAHTALNTGIVSMDGFTKNDITRLGQVAALAKKVSEETH